MKTLIMLIRREFWEHRGLWAAPLVTAAMLVLVTLVGRTAGGAIHISINGKAMDFLAAAAGPMQEKFFAVFVSGLLLPQLLVALIVVFFYLLDTLYSERKDRSILFWKSMPVSDGITVGSKALVALVVVPLMVWGLSLLVSVLCVSALSFRLSGSGFASLLHWHTGGWLQVQAAMLVNLAIASLWYAPIAAALLLASVLARRGVVLWAVLPPLLLIIGERVALGTQRVAAFLSYRFTGYFDAIGPGFGGHEDKSASTAEQLAELSDRFDKISALPLLSNPDLWLGVLAAAGLLWLTVRMRRYRDDT